MARTAITFKSTRERKLAAAARAIKQARATSFNARRSNFGRAFGIGVRKSIAEKKTIDVDPANYGADTTGSVTLLNGVATGTDFTDRIGRKIILKSVYVRGVLKPGTLPSLNTNCRLIIVYDTQANGAAPAVTDVLKSATSASQLNLNNRDRFKIVLDKTFPLGAVVNTATQSYAVSPSIHVLKKFKSLNMETLYNGIGATVASIASGSLYAITIGDQANPNGGTFNLSYRTRFIDA